MNVLDNSFFPYTSNKNIQNNGINSFIIKDFLVNTMKKNYCFATLCYLLNYT